MASPVFEPPQAHDAAGSDAALTARAKHDPDAFGEIYERYVTAIYRYVYYRVADAQDAEDLTARVFMRALRHIRGYDERGLPFSAWLYRIAHNVVVNFHRDRARKPAVSLDELNDDGEAHEAEPHDENAHDSDHAIDLAQDQRRLIDAIRGLSEERQQLIVLKFVEQLPNAEIGQIMKRSEGAIKSLYHRTLLQLRERLSSPDA